jgi:hypothetical protein
MEKIDLLRSYDSDFDERIEELDYLEADSYLDDSLADVEDDEFYDSDDL